MRTQPGKPREKALRTILENQRLRVLDALRETVHTEREAGAMHGAEVEDDPERSDANLLSGIDFAMAQMRSETLALIDEALGRLDEGQFGRCVDCDSEISATRLAAIPFATRCRACAEDNERASAPAEQMAWQRSL